MLNTIGKKLGYKDGGFTIIEVLIVLAVAGLIMAIVLVAIPQLQRNQRNTARREVLGRIKTELDAFAGNNNGKIPGTISSAANTDNDLDSLYQRYLGCGNAANAQDTATPPATLANCSVNIEDPTTGYAMSMSSVTPVAVGNIPTSPALGTPGLGRIEYARDRTCNGETLAAGSGRNYAMWLRLEGDAIYCLDNA